MRLTISILFILCFASLCIAQTDQCKITLADSPEVRGFKLGQKYEDVVKGFPSGRYSGVLDYEGEFGLRSVDILDVPYHARLAASLPETKLPDEWVKRFEGADSVNLEFLDGMLVSIEISYDDSTKWDNPLEFTAAIASALKLPTEGWRGRPYHPQLVCAGFTVETWNETTRPRFIMKTIGYESEIAKRKADAEKKKRTTFKP
jgi:hypothetical protein